MKKLAVLDLKVVKT